MSETPHISDFLDNEVFVSKIPFNYYLTSIILTGLLLFFLALTFIGQLDIWGAAICFLFFGSVIFANFGRYLAKIKLYGHRIEVHYYFPWNSSETFRFDKLSEIDHKDMPWLTRYDRWYRGYQWLYLKNDKGQVWQIRYNINENDDNKLLKELRRNLE